MPRGASVTIVLFFFAVTGCTSRGKGARSPDATGPAALGDPRHPAADLSALTAGAPPPSVDSVEPIGTGSHYDLEEVRLITKRDGSIDAVAPTTLFDRAKEQLDGGHPLDAIRLFRQLADEFPSSRLTPVALFNVGVVYENLGDVIAAIAAYHSAVARVSRGPESMQAHLRAAGLEAEHGDWPAAERTLREIEGRDDLTFADRIELSARLGYVLLEQGRVAASRAALESAVAAWRRAPHVDDPYFIAMAHYYLGELEHRTFVAMSLRSADDLLKADLDAKEALASRAYDAWKDALELRSPYWSVAAGYRMSQVFAELWEVAVHAPYPDGLSREARQQYEREVRDRVRRHLFTALDGHQMNLQLAAAYGVDNPWNRASRLKIDEITAILAGDARRGGGSPAPLRPRDGSTKP